MSILNVPKNYDVYGQPDDRDALIQSVANQAAAKEREEILKMIEKEISNLNASWERFGRDDEALMASTMKYVVKLIQQRNEGRGK